MRKKCNFLETSTSSLQLDNVKVVWGRAETLGCSPEHREVRMPLPVASFMRLLRFIVSMHPFCRAMPLNLHSQLWFQARQGASRHDADQADQGCS